MGTTMEAGADGADAKNIVNSVLRACTVMEVLAAARGEVSLAAVAAAAGLTRPTAHRLLATLQIAGWVRRSPQGQYALTIKVFTVGSAAQETVTLRDLAHPALAQLAAETGDTSYLLVPHDGRAACIDRVEGPHPVRVHAVAVGGSVPLTAGGAPLAMLAWRPDLFDEVAPPAGRARTALRRRLAEAREQGYAMTSDDMIPGVSALGAPVLDRTGVAVAGVSVAGTNDRFTGVELARRAKAVIEASREISELLRRSS